MFKALTTMIKTYTNSIFITLGTAAFLLQLIAGFVGDTILSLFMLGLLHLRSKI